MHDVIINYWAVIVVSICSLFLGYFLVAKFLSLPTVTQIEKLKEWLLWAVIEAEKELGSGTGELKLRKVYDMFLQRFPKLSAFISFEYFSKLVDDVLDKMRKLLLENQKLKTHVVEGEVVKNE